MRKKTQYLMSALVFALGLSSSINLKQGTENDIYNFNIAVEFRLASEVEAAYCSTPERFLRRCCPRPCPVLDTSKVTQIISQVTEETNKVQQYISQLSQWRGMLKIIGVDLGDIQGLLSMFKGAGGAQGLSILTEAVTQNLPKAMEGVNLESIADIKTKSTNLYHAPNPTPEILNQRSQFTSSATDSALATAMEVQKGTEKQQEKIKKLAEATGKAKTKREDFAANTAAKLALYEMMHDMSKLEGSFAQMSSLLNMSGIGSMNSGSGNFSSSSTPFSIDKSKLPPNEGPMKLDPYATALYDAAKRINQAITIHNQAVAVKEMIDGYNTAQQMRDTWKNYENISNTTYDVFIRDLNSAYTNNASAGKSIFTDGVKYTTGSYADMIELAPQLNSIQWQMGSYLAQSAEHYGKLLCAPISNQGGSSGGGGDNSARDDTGPQIDCYQQARNNAALVAASQFYNVLFTKKQADWYYQFELQGEELQKEAVEQIEASNKFVNMDLTNLENVLATQEKLMLEAYQIAPIGVLTSFVESSANDRTAKNIIYAIEKIRADTGFNYYISYDKDTGNVETGTLIDHLTPTGTENNPITPDNEFDPENETEDLLE